MCSSSRSARSADRAHMRVSQAERDRAVDDLRDHAAAGRLDMDELEQRVERALSAATAGELAALFFDLPRTARGGRPSAVARTASGAAALFALMPLLFGIAVLVLAPPAFAWVGWTALGWWFFAGLPAAGIGFGFASCASKRHRRRRLAA